MKKSQGGKKIEVDDGQLEMNSEKVTVEQRTEDGRQISAT